MPAQKRTRRAATVELFTLPVGTRCRLPRSKSDTWEPREFTLLRAGECSCTVEYHGLPLITDDPDKTKLSPSRKLNIAAGTCVEVVAPVAIPKRRVAKKGTR